jgi:hypothetical protein
MLTHFSKSAVSLIIQQRIIVYIFAYTLLCSSDKTYSLLSFSFFFVSSNLINSLLGKLNATLKKCQDRDILSLMRNPGNIKKELLDLFRNASRVCLHFLFCVIISGLIDVSRSRTLRIFSTNCSSSIPLPCQQILMSSSQMRTHVKNLLKLRVLEHSLSLIFFMRYVYELFTPCCYI